jgi:hypothetical protein
MHKKPKSPLLKRILLTFMITVITTPFSAQAQEAPDSQDRCGYAALLTGGLGVTLFGGGLGYGCQAAPLSTFGYVIGGAGGVALVIGCCGFFGPPCLRLSHNLCVSCGEAFSPLRAPVQQQMGQNSGIQDPSTQLLSPQ